MTRLYTALYGFIRLYTALYGYGDGYRRVQTCLINYKSAQSHHRVPQAVEFSHPYNMIASQFDFGFIFSVLS